MSQIIVVAVIAVIASLGSRYRPLCILFLLMPFNSIIKDFFVYIDKNGAVFSLWKELVILIFFAKNFRMNHLHAKSLTPFFLVELGLFLFFMFFGMANHDMFAALLKFRDLIIPQLLVFATLSMEFDERKVKKLLIFFAIAVFFSCLLGFYEAYGGGRFAIAVFKRAAIQIGLDGTVYYPAAWMIMGHYRMFGVLDSPNQFGIFLTMFVIYCITFRDRIYLARKELLYGKIVLVIAVLCVIFSFSRTSAFILVITFALRFANKKNIQQFVYAGVLLAVIIVCLCFISESFSQVFIGTFDGSEASAADRKNNFSLGLNFALSNPLGCGLGSSYPHGNVPPVYFAESGYLNLCVETGFLGLAVYVLFNLIFTKILKTYRSFNEAKYAKGVIIATFVASFVSINPMECIYTYYFWVYIALVIKLCYRRKIA